MSGDKSPEFRYRELEGRLWRLEQKQEDLNTDYTNFKAEIEEIIYGENYGDTSGESKDR